VGKSSSEIVPWNVLEGEGTMRGRGGGQRRRRGLGESGMSAGVS